MSRWDELKSNTRWSESSRSPPASPSCGCRGCGVDCDRTSELMWSLTFSCVSGACSSWGHRLVERLGDTAGPCRPHSASREAISGGECLHSLRRCFFPSASWTLERAWCRRFGLRSAVQRRDETPPFHTGIMRRLLLDNSSHFKLSLRQMRRFSDFIVHIKLFFALVFSYTGDLQLLPLRFKTTKVDQKHWTWLKEHNKTCRLRKCRIDWVTTFNFLPKKLENICPIS